MVELLKQDCNINLISQMMGDRKPENSDMVKSMVHGKPSRRDGSGQSMFDIFTWQSQDNANIANQNLKYFNAHQICRCERPKQDQVCCHHNLNEQFGQNYNRVEEINNEQEDKNQYMLVKAKPQLKPHQIKNQLYMYEDVHLKRNRSQQPKLNKSQIKAKQKKSQIQTKKKLNYNNEKDKQIIQRRKERIKQFRQFTRDLPNSAFVTYYGKPAFESYGRANSNANLKTHNVMPHKGENHPKTQQTYSSALINANKIKNEDHLPRKPLEEHKYLPKKKDISDRIDKIPLEKPDLVNHIRFSEPSAQSERKQSVPLHTDINYIPKRSQKPKKQRRRKNEKMMTQSDFGDGLKFMNTRDNLISLLEDKKIKDSRLAYKVTQCYPEAKCDKRKTQSDAQYYERPAGIVYERGEPAQKIIYRRQ